MDPCSCESVTILDLITHTKCFLECFIKQHGTLTYFLICLIIFCETGLVATPFLPGDSLLFTAGMFANIFPDILNIYLMVTLIICAAVVGDNLNYLIGHTIGIRIFKLKFLHKIIKQEYLIKTEKFYEKHGGKTIIMARFVPIIRTFAPFAAGMGSMTYKRYIVFCVSGALLWVGLLCFAGYFFGTHPWVQANYEKVVLGIILISLLPILVGVFRKNRGEK